MNSGRDPLTQEERALAARLARLGAPGGPPAALDARILGAAHDAVLRAPARRRARRWPLAFGAAASVALALGIAWQLRPTDDTTQVFQESDMARAPRASGPSAADELPMAADAAAPAADAASAESSALPQASVDAPAATAAPRQAAQSLQAPARVEEAEAFPPQAQPAPPPAPPAPPPPPAPAAGNAASDIVFDAPAAVAAPAPPQEADALREASARERRASSEKAVAHDPELDQITVTGSRVAREREGFTDAELDDEPPATADSPQVQRAWLQRIREMVAAGDRDGARASLEEFRRRYPRYALPDDLRDLLP